MEANEQEIDQNMLAEKRNAQIALTTKLAEHIQGQPLDVAFAATVDLARFLIRWAAQAPGAQKECAKLLLSEAANSAFSAGLTDEELQEAILSGERDAKAAMEGAAEAMRKLMEVGGEPN